MFRPSNLGSGAAAQTLACRVKRGWRWTTSEGKLGGGISASLVVADQPQDLAEAGHGQETAVLRVCNLPYFAQDGGRELGPLEELDGNLAGYDAELLCVGLLEQVLEHALFLGGEVEDGLVCDGLAGVHRGVWAAGRSSILNSPLAERSAMAVERAGDGARGR